MSESGLADSSRAGSVWKGVVPWLLEGLFIVISVLLGFAAAQYGESRADRNLAHRALTNLQAELEYNLGEVEPYIAFHRAHISALREAKIADGNESGFLTVMRLRPALPSHARADVPLVRRAAWDAAASSGALRLIDYDLIASLSEIYQMQDHLGEASGRIPMSSPAFFDPSQRAPSIHLTRMALNEIAWSEESLVALYRKHLPALQAAARGE
jgi:hypothetical protein